MTVSSYVERHLERYRNQIQDEGLVFFAEEIEPILTKHANGPKGSGPLLTVRHRGKTRRPAQHRDDLDRRGTDRGGALEREGRLLEPFGQKGLAISIRRTIGKKETIGKSHEATNHSGGDQTR